MLEKKNLSVVNDGKVVMVVLTVRDKATGITFDEVGRATCDLETDKFDLKFGTDLAEDRAYTKALKRAIKYHEHAQKSLLKIVNEHKNEIVSLTKRLK